MIEKKRKENSIIILISNKILKVYHYTLFPIERLNIFNTISMPRELASK